MWAFALTVLIHFVTIVACFTDQPSRRLSVLITAPPMSGHMAVPFAVGEELVRRGHNVTFFTANIKNYDRPRKWAEKVGMVYSGVDVNATYDAYEAVMEQLSVANRSSLLSLFYSFFTGEISFVQSVMLNVESALHVDGPLLRNYDVILTTEVAFPVVMCVSRKWNVPLILLGSLRQVFTHQLPPWPHPVPLSHRTDNLNFQERLYETLQRHALTLLFDLMMKLMGLKLNCPHKISALVQAAGVSVPHIVPTTIGLEYPRSLTPLTTYTGPILSPVTDQLPEDVQVWLDSHATGSVVYISMGSVAVLSHEAARAIVEGLHSTGYSAVWSLKEKNRAILDELELDDKKILLLDWAPQLAILRHRSIRMAILHGGINGVHEALHSGVPIIVLPLFADQPANAVAVVYHGLGVKLDIGNLTGAQIAESISAIDKGNYHKNIARLSKIFHHAGGVTRASDLVEFYADVGYDHLIPAYVRYEWTWIQYYNVDVYLLLLVIGGLVVFATLRLCRCCCFRCCARGAVFSDKPKQE